MSLTLSQLGAIKHLVSTNPAQAKALIKLASVSVLQSLGSENYSVSLGQKKLTVESQTLLKEGSKYWSQMSQTKSQTPTLMKPIAMPQLLQTLDKDQFHYTLKDLRAILDPKTSPNIMKQSLLENLASSSTKEEFTQFSNLLLSLQNQVLTLPLLFNNSFSLLQLKKRYNNKTKKHHLEFYAALELLGPISGVVSLDHGEVTLFLNVAYEKTKQFLEDDMKNFSYTVSISVSQTIEPLYEPLQNSLLDLSI